MDPDTRGGVVLPSARIVEVPAVGVPARILRSARAAEEGVALGQEVAIGLEVVGARHVDAPALKALEAMQEHRSVDFLQHVEAHVTSRSGVTPTYDRRYERLYLAFIAGRSAFGLAPRATVELAGSQRRLDRIVRPLRARLSHRRPSTCLVLSRRWRRSRSRGTLGRGDEGCERLDEDDHGIGEYASRGR